MYIVISDKSQGSVATHVIYGSMFNNNFLASLSLKEFLKIGENLAKKLAKLNCLVFFESQCICIPTTLP